MIKYLVQRAGLVGVVARSHGGRTTFATAMVTAITADPAVFAARKAGDRAVLWLIAEGRQGIRSARSLVASRTSI